MPQHQRRSKTKDKAAAAVSNAGKAGGTPAALLRSRFEAGMDAAASDDDSNNDNVSLYSYASSRNEGRDEVTSPGCTEDGGLVGCEDGDDGYYDDFEDKLLEAIESASEKSTKARILALDSIGRAFKSRYLFDFICDRKVTIMDMMERSVKKGKGEEQGSAALLSSVVATTLGPGAETEAMFKDLTALMLTLMADNSTSVPVRSACATAVGVNCFIHAEEDIGPVTEVLLSLFSGSFLKGNGALQSNLSPAVTSMHAHALMSWSLLLTVQSAAAVYALTEKFGTRISELLDSADVELRIAAGETIAVMYEVCTEVDDEFELENHEDLVHKLKQLATDSQKHRAKKDRRVQRSSFRDILKSLEDGERPSLMVKFGRERLILDSWCSKRQYDALCTVLGPGMNLHLAENDLVRDIFDLGSPVSAVDGPVKLSKFARHMENLAADRARTKSRSRLRDKRADILLPC